MISIEKARELKEAGCSKPVDEGFYFAPSISQLLAEIEARGYWWELRRSLNSKYRIMLYLKVDGACALGSEYGNIANSPEDAAANALLWIISKEHDNPELLRE